MKIFVNKLFSYDHILPFVIISFAAWYFSYASGLHLIYNDAMSHLNMARLITDNQEPGLAQLGGVWLPLNHILPLVFIWNDWAWHSGFAESIFSMISYIVAAWAIFQTIFRLTGKKAASFVGALAFALNLNMLYVQTTPLTEPLYIMLFALSGYVFTLYVTTKTKGINYLLILGALGFLQVLTRYDGWFVVAVEALLIGLYELFIVRKTIHEAIGKLFIFCSPVALGIGLWLLWNLLIFNNMFFFALGEYSARSQQAVYEGRGALITKGEVLMSAWTYLLAMRHTIGLYALILAGFGGAVFLFSKKLAGNVSIKVLILFFFAAPIIFNILALFLGFSIIYVPEVNPSDSIRSDWFNVRYALLALPFIALLFGSFASLRKLTLIIAVEVILLQSVVTYNSGVAAITDGKVGTSAFDAPLIAEGIKSHIKPEDTVLMSVYSFNPVIFKSGMDLDQIIHEGVSKKWDKSLKNPQDYADWVVVANESKDQVYQRLVEEKNPNFLRNYSKVYTANNASIYKRNIAKSQEK